MSLCSTISSYLFSIYNTLKRSFEIADEALLKLAMSIRTYGSELQSADINVKKEEDDDDQGNDAGVTGEFEEEDDDDQVNDAGVTGEFEEDDDDDDVDVVDGDEELERLMSNILTFGINIGLRQMMNISQESGDGGVEVGVGEEESDEESDEKETLERVLEELFTTIYDTVKRDISQRACDEGGIGVGEEESDEKKSLERVWKELFTVIGDIAKRDEKERKSVVQFMSNLFTSVIEIGTRQMINISHKAEDSNHQTT